MLLTLMGNLNMFGGQKCPPKCVDERKADDSMYRILFERKRREEMIAVDDDNVFSILNVFLNVNN